MLNISNVWFGVPPAATPEPTEHAETAPTDTTTVQGLRNTQTVVWGDSPLHPDIVKSAAFHLGKNRRPIIAKAPDGKYGCFPTLSAFRIHVGIPINECRQALKDSTNTKAGEYYISYYSNPSGFVDTSPVKKLSMPVKLIEQRSRKETVYGSLTDARNGAISDTALLATMLASGDATRHKDGIYRLVPATLDDVLKTYPNWKPSRSYTVVAASNDINDVVLHNKVGYRAGKSTLTGVLNSHRNTYELVPA